MMVAKGLEWSGRRIIPGDAHVMLTIGYSTSLAYHATV